MKLRHVLGGLLTAAVVAVPVAAVAADYTPYSGSDDPADAGEPSNPTIDILGVKGVRGDDTIKFNVTYAATPQATRTRYNVALYATDYRLLELVNDANGKVRVNFFKYALRVKPAQLAKGIAALEKTSCPGATVTRAADKPQLRFTVPVDCVPGADTDAGTFFFTTAGRWTPETFPGSRPSNQDRSEANRSDDYADAWSWSSMSGGPSPSVAP